MINPTPCIPRLPNDATGVGSRSQEMEPPVTNNEENRSPEALNEILDSLDPENDIRYRAIRINGVLETWCNIYAWDATKAMGCEIPHWYNPETGEKMPVNAAGADEMNCIRMINWINNFGSQNGWSVATAEEAQLHANQGKPAIALNPEHVVMMRPYDPAYSETKSKAVCVHVGAPPNKRYCTVDSAFGKTPTPQYYIHD